MVGLFYINKNFINFYLVHIFTDSVIILIGFAIWVAL